jgi:hypothetical protein
VGLRRWLKRVERDSKESSGTYTLIDTETGEEFEVPRDAGMLVIAHALEDEEDVYSLYPWMRPLGSRLHRLVDRDTGEPFFLYPTRTATSNTLDKEED